jgi:Organic Anion Transporter Polypeptide (OATP) family
VIFTTLTFSYLGKSSHKTRWVAYGTVLVGLSCFVRLIPHWLYGPGENALQLTQEYSAHPYVANGTMETTGLGRKTFLAFILFQF